MCIYRVSLGLWPIWWKGNINNIIIYSNKYNNNNVIYYLSIIRSYIARGGNVGCQLVGPPKKRRTTQDIKPASLEKSGPQKAYNPHRLACGLRGLNLIKKNLHLCILVTFLLDFCMNIPNSYITRRNKYYVLLNVLKFEE